MTKSVIFILLISCAVVMAYWVWTPEYIRFDQMNDVTGGDDIPFSTQALVTFGYTPDVFPYYLNMVCPCYGMDPHWIVRNIYLPDASWIESFQYISYVFDLTQLGGMPGYPYEEIGYRCYLSDTALLEFPIPSIYDWTMADTFTNDPGGMEFPDTIPGLEPDSAHPEFVEGDTITELEYRGCRMKNIDLDDGSHPDTPTYAGDKNACGPASAANSLKWLSDVSDDVDIPESLREVMEELSGRMGRERNEGVTTRQLIEGKLDYIHAHGLNIQVKFQSYYLPRDSGDVVAPSGPSVAKNQGDLTNPYPTWEWLKSEIADSEDVEILYHGKKASGRTWGHAAVVSGIEETASGKKTIKIKHDRRQARADTTRTIQEPLDIYIDSYGRMRIRGKRAAITGVISESPGDPYLGVSEHGSMPEQFDIHVSPNPFNSAVRINVDAPARIEIYDIVGRKIADTELVEVSASGIVNRPSTGSGLESVWIPEESQPSGVYLIKATSPTATATKRILYLK